MKSKFSSFIRDSGEAEKREVYEKVMDAVNKEQADLVNNPPNYTQEEHYQDTSAHYDKRYKGIKLDPYRIAAVYCMRGGPREQIMKKCLRFTDKGQTEQQVVAEISDALQRWKDMLEEDEQ